MNWSAPPGPKHRTAGHQKGTHRKGKDRREAVLAKGSCLASYYAEGQLTASGQRFNPEALTAAHKTLPLGSKVRVHSKSTGRSVRVRINDRGPYVAGRCLDLSRAAMREVGGIGAGVTRVSYEVLSRG